MVSSEVNCGTVTCVAMHAVYTGTRVQTWVADTVVDCCRTKRAHHYYKVAIFSEAITSGIDFNLSRTHNGVEWNIHEE